MHCCIKKIHSKKCMEKYRTTEKSAGYAVRFNRPRQSPADRHSIITGCLYLTHHSDSSDSAVLLRVPSRTDGSTQTGARAEDLCRVHTDGRSIPCLNRLMSFRLTLGSGCAFRFALARRFAPGSGCALGCAQARRFALRSRRALGFACTRRFALAGHFALGRGFTLRFALARRFALGCGFTLRFALGCRCALRFALAGCAHSGRRRQCRWECG